MTSINKSGEPVATLHDDGYWTWKKGKEILESRYAGWRMDVYAAPQLFQPAQAGEACDHDYINGQCKKCGCVSAGE